jgi:Zn-dependent protease/predicted transcriptional regulator
MRATVRLGKVGGVSVGAHWSTLFVLALFATMLATTELPSTAPGYPTAAYWVVAVLLAGVFLASILAHELAHAAVARHHGVGVDSITLWLLGGIAQLHEHARDPEAELRIALAGPATSIAIGAAAGVLAVALYGVGGSGLVVGALGWLAMVSMLLGIFNLLPGAPLDGGRVLTAVLWRRSGDERAARRRSAQIGQVLGQVMIGIGIFDVLVGVGIGGLWFVLLGWFVMAAARGEEAQLDLTGALGGVRVADVMTPQPVVVRRGTSVAEFVAHESLHTRGSSFPVVDDRGQVCGLVTFRRVRAVPHGRWATTTVDDVALPVDELWTAAPDEKLLDVLARGRGGDGRIVVLDGEHVVGIVSPTDVTRAVQRLGLQADLSRGG